MADPEEVFCPYCGAQAEWLPDTAVYRTSYGNMVYVCQPCAAWVGCHKNKNGEPGTRPTVCPDELNQRVALARAAAERPRPGARHRHRNPRRSRAWWPAPCSSKELRYVGSKYPICSLVRVRKFVGRGWRINAGQILKMAMQISELDLTSVEVLEDQLTGVDTAYFVQLMDKMKEKDPAKVDTAYLVELIDKIF